MSRETDRGAAAAVAGTLLAVLMGWEGLALHLAAPALPAPTQVAGMAAWLARDGTLFTDMVASLRRVFTGFTVAAVLGLGLGALGALGGQWTAGLRALVAVIRPIPPIAWIPLSILWFGLGDPSAWFIVFIGAFAPVFVQTCWALSRCPPRYLELSRSLGAGPWLTLLRVRLPAAAPGVVAGLRTGLGLAWTSVIAAELVGAQSGLGYRIQMHRVVLETDGVMVGMVCIGLCGLVMDGLARQVERRLVDWAP
ncbi:MAG: nitrate ABC transporter permease [Deltaproteobacteria bacterium]|nr:nitrate ABC transporter permease [Deltaproteobacteria bacterium]HCH65415.1 ABC transporter permease [Deltaproteobacteria bacterium]